MTFGNVFTVTISGRQECDSEDQIGCGATELYLSSLLFTDGSGLPLPNVTLEPVPELPGWMLLATCVMGIALLRNRKFILGHY